MPERHPSHRPDADQALLAAIAALTCCAVLQAQPLFERQLVDDHFELLPAGSFATLDVDRDGDQDVVADDRLLLNDGAGRLVAVAAASLPPARGAAQQILVGDLDGDGDEDLIVVQGLPRLFRNDFPALGFTELSATHLPALPAARASVALGDVDGDGDLDLALGLLFVSPGGRDPFGAARNRLLLNDGTGRFADATDARMPVEADATRTTVFADVDGDRDLDLIFGNDVGRGATTPSRVCLNDGSGSFVVSATRRLPGDTTKALLAVDVDGDGDQDLLGASPAGLFRNDGRGNFLADARLPSGLPGGMVTLDVEGDGDLDVVYSDLFPGGPEHGGRLFLNDGRGSFRELVHGHGLERAGGPVAAFDHDGDGDDDLLFGNGVRHVNGGGGSFAAAHAPWLTATRLLDNALAQGDFDADGEIDLLVGSQVLLQRNGRLQHDASIAAGSAAVSADFDGDGDLDLVVTRWNGPTRLYRNDGSGAFQEAPPSWRPASDGGAFSLAAFDVDHDGDMDLLLAGRTREQLWRNDGSGSFVDATPTQLPRVAHAASDLAVGDVDGDGRLDLVVAHGVHGNVPGGGVPDRLLLGSVAAPGHFVDAAAGRLPGGVGGSVSLALADLDADGDLDLVCGRSGQDLLLLNDGTGAFHDMTSTHLPPSSPQGVTRHIAVGDADDDGVLDLLLARVGFRPVLLRGQANGAFVDATDELLGSTGVTHPAKVALADFDGDADHDLLVVEDSTWPTDGSWGGPPGRSGRHLFTNTARQLRALRLALLGAPWELEFVVRRAADLEVCVALPFVAPGRARTALPGIGVVGLDPMHMQSLPLLALMPPHRQATLAVPLPNDAGLVGVDLHAQALLVGSASGLRLTGVVHDRILR